MPLEIQFPRVQGYRVELPEDRLTALFNEDSVLELTPDLVGPSVTRNAGIIGEGVDLNLEHLQDLRRSTLLFCLTRRLIYTKWRDPWRGTQAVSFWKTETDRQAIGLTPAWSVKGALTRPN